MRPRADDVYSSPTWGDRKASPRFPSLADLEARREQRNYTLLCIIAAAAYLVVAGIVAAIAYYG